MNIAKTTLSSKILTGDKEHFANLAVDAIMRLKGKPLRGPDHTGLHTFNPFLFGSRAGAQGLELRALAAADWFCCPRHCHMFSAIDVGSNGYHLVLATAAFNWTSYCSI